jgi:hypothetical protein
MKNTAPLAEHIELTVCRVGHGVGAASASVRTGLMASDAQNRENQTQDEVLNLHGFFS